MKKIARYLFGLAIVCILNLCVETDEFNPELFNQIKGSWQIIEYYHYSVMSSYAYHSSDSANYLDYPYPVIMNFNENGDTNIEYSDGQISNYRTWTTKNNNLIITDWIPGTPGYEFIGDIIKLTDVELHAELTYSGEGLNQVFGFELKR
jgi:hypothetical protein